MRTGSWMTGRSDRPVSTPPAFVCPWLAHSLWQRHLFLTELGEDIKSCCLLIKAAFNTLIVRLTSAFNHRLPRRRKHTTVTLSPTTREDCSSTKRRPTSATDLRRIYQLKRLFIFTAMCVGTIIFHYICQTIYFHFHRLRMQMMKECYSTWIALLYFYKAQGQRNFCGSISK